MGAHEGAKYPWEGVVPVSVSGIAASAWHLLESRGVSLSSGALWRRYREIHSVREALQAAGAGWGVETAALSSAAALVVNEAGWAARSGPSPT